MPSIGVTDEVARACTPSKSCLDDARRAHISNAVAFVRNLVVNARDRHARQIRPFEPSKPTRQDRARRVFSMRPLS